jgi:hypothetical protein
MPKPGIKADTDKASMKENDMLKKIEARYKFRKK